MRRLSSWQREGFGTVTPCTLTPLPAAEDPTCSGGGPAFPRMEEPRSCGNPRRRAKSSVSGAHEPPSRLPSLPHWSLSSAWASAWMVRLPYDVQPGGPVAGSVSQLQLQLQAPTPRTVTPRPLLPLRPTHQVTRPNEEPRMQPRAQTLCATHVILLHFALNSA